MYASFASAAVLSHDCDALQTRTFHSMFDAVAAANGCQFILQKLCPGEQMAVLKLTRKSFEHIWRTFSQLFYLNDMTLR